MKRDYKIFLKDILKEIENINHFVDSTDFKTFSSDEKTKYAVARSLEIIGEAVSMIPEEIKEKHTNIPWKDIKNFRNVVVHKYWDIDVEIVWDIIDNELKPLYENIKYIIKP
jgi:uncharacterized protein with HEPN domain